MSYSRFVLVLAPNELKLANGVFEKIARIEPVIPPEFEKRAVKIIGPGLGCRDHHRAAGLAVLGREAVGQRLEFGDHIRVGIYRIPTPDVEAAVDSVDIVGI